MANVSVVRSINAYPSAIDLTRLLRSLAPHCVFLSVEVAVHAGELAKKIEQIMPGVQVVALAPTYDADTLRGIMRCGIREFLTLPTITDDLRACLAQVAENLILRPIANQHTGEIYAFLPSKPGVGATTIAINTSLALARNKDTPSLLMDCDLNCGLVRFMLKLESNYGVLDAAAHVGSMDDGMWPHIINRVEALDVIHAGPLNPDVRLEHVALHRLLDYVRRNYRVVCADLSGNLEKYAMEVLHESKKIFLVCTPEIPSLHLAADKMNYLRRLDLGDRVGVLLNRFEKRSTLAPADVEQIAVCRSPTSCPTSTTRSPTRSLKENPFRGRRSSPRLHHACRSNHRPTQHRAAVIAPVC